MTGLALHIGQELRGYRLRELRGETKYAHVWDAESPAGEPMVLKFLLGANEFTVRQEIRAIQLIGRLQHPNLLPVDEVWSHGKCFVIAMKRADGNLQDLFEAYQTEYGTGIEAHDLCALLTQAAAGLDFLNQHKHHLGSWPVGIQHCNIKPTNLLLFGDTVKISDFGLASPASWGVRPQRIGTPEYLAPEVLQGRLSTWSDQFALAVTYCYLRSGRYPFSDVLQPGKSFHGRAAPDLTMLTPAERPVLARALAAVGQQRWPTCTEMFTQLLQALRPGASGGASASPGLCGTGR